MSGRFCKNYKRCSMQELGPCDLWECCPVFKEVSVVEKILEARRATEKEMLQSTAKNKNKV